MEEQSKRIELEEGIGLIKFGISRNKLREIAGEPDEIESYQHAEVEGRQAEAWHYDEAGLSFAFEEFNDWRLASIAVSSPEYTLRGMALHGRPYDEVVSFIRKFKFGELIEEDLGKEDSVEMKLVTIDEVGLNLWFENDILSEIQFSQVWNGDE